MKILNHPKLAALACATFFITSPPYLKTVPVDGGEAQVVEYLYEGQGTINAPSWKPDGKHLAFVGHTGKTD